MNGTASKLFKACEYCVFSSSTMKCFARKHLYLLMYLGSTLATGYFDFLTQARREGYKRISSNTKYDAKTIKSFYLYISKDATVEYHNSQAVSHEDSVVNYGKMIFTTNDSAVTADEGFIHYEINAFYNKGLFLVHHNNRELPICTVIHGTEQKVILIPGRWWTSENLGTVIYLTNSKITTVRPFFIDIKSNFINLGSISVLGTWEQLGRFDFLGSKKKKQSERFTNNGIIYIKNANFIQGAKLAGEGCIVMGHNSGFYLDADFEISKQQLHFVDGHGALITGKDTEGRHTRCYITNFPKGSLVRVKTGILRWRVEGSDLIFTDTRGRESITITFEGFTLEERKVVVDGNEVTYAEDLLTHYPDYPCAKMYLVMEEASKYEIKA